MSNVSICYSFFMKIFGIYSSRDGKRFFPIKYQFKFFAFSSPYFNSFSESISMTCSIKSNRNSIVPDSKRCMIFFYGSIICIQEICRYFIVSCR